MGVPNRKKNSKSYKLRISNALYHEGDEDALRNKYERGKDRVKHLIIAVFIAFIALFVVLIIWQMLA